MKVLSILNISNKDNIECDSGYIFQCIIANCFIANGDKYVVAGSDCKQFRRAKGLKAAKKYIKLGTNKYSARFDFDSDEISKLILDTKPDIIFNTQAELTSAIRSVLVWNKLEIPLVTYCHYPALWANKLTSDTPELDESLNAHNIGQSIVFDILGTLQTSDLFIIQSNFAKSLIEKAARYHRVKYNKNKFIVIPPPADSDFLDNKYLSSQLNDKSFVYNHRLYKTYGTEDFINIYLNIYKKFGIKCKILDPMANRSDKRQTHNPSPNLLKQQMSNLECFDTGLDNATRKKYKNILLNSLGCFAPLRRACVWSMACVDCMGLGIPVIAPKMAAYPEFVPPYLLYTNEKQLHRIVNSLIFDEQFRQKASKQCYRMACRLSGETISEKLRHQFAKLLDRKQCAE